LTNDTNLI